jgi:hypothetical protein
MSDKIREDRFAATLSTIRGVATIHFLSSPQRRKGAEETQRKPIEACQEAGGFRFAPAGRYIAVARLSVCIFVVPSNFVLLSFAFPLRLCASAVKGLFGV